MNCRIVKRLYCQEVGVEYEENLFMFSETPRKDSTGCLSVIMTGRSGGADQDMTEARVGSLYQVVEFLGLGRNVVEEGIFRKTGTVRKQQELLERIERGEDLELEDGHYTTHECASVLKTFLANLTEPLVTTACYKGISQRKGYQKTSKSFCQLTSKWQIFPGRNLTRNCSAHNYC